MRLVSYLAEGKTRFGVVAGEGVVTMSERYPSLRDALAAGALDELGRAADKATPDRKLAEIRFLPVIPNPDKILCAGINYRSHGAEMGRELPKQPSMFARLSNTLLGHEGEIVRPRVSQCLDFEGELAVVIGRGGRHIRAVDALRHVAGYTCFNDGSVRDFQRHSVTAGKNFPATGALGPWLVTADEIPDPARLTLATHLNGKEVQRSGTDQLIHDVPAIIAYVSSFTPLAPGDVIATGTPEGVGVGRTPPLWMKAGDVIEVTISGVGTLRNRVADEVG